jgi:hypothetical protein
LSARTQVRPGAARRQTPQPRYVRRRQASRKCC